MIDLVDVSYRYAGAASPSLRGLSLRLDRGEIAGLVGPNGAGKSTLALVISGLAPGSIGGHLSGTVLIDGDPGTELEPAERAERVAVVFGDPAANRTGATATVFEEVAFGPVNLGLPATETVRRTRAALVTLGIADLAHRDPSRLSGGETQLVAIAGALALGAHHLVLDEPTSQLDAPGTERVADALRTLARAGIGILVVEQRLDVLDGLCDRVLALDDGRLVLDAGAEDAFDDPELVRIGVEPPARVLLRQALLAAGLDAAANVVGGRV